MAFKWTVAWCASALTNPQQKLCFLANQFDARFCQLSRVQCCIHFGQNVNHGGVSRTVLRQQPLHFMLQKKFCAKGPIEGGHAPATSWLAGDAFMHHCSHLFLAKNVNQLCIHYWSSTPTSTYSSLLFAQTHSIQLRSPLNFNEIHMFTEVHPFYSIKRLPPAPGHTNPYKISILEKRHHYKM